MSNDPQQQPSGGTPSPGDPHAVTQQIDYSHVAARIPEKIGRGTFATNVLTLTGAQELVCDFLLRLVPPTQLAARVVIPYSALGPMIKAINDNLDNYRSRFGNPVPLPTPPPNTPPPNIAEIYEQMKLPEDVAVGSYANTLMITHSACDFCFDFILDAFPKPVVTSRVYLAPPQVVAWLDTMKRTWGQVQSRQQQPPPSPSGDPGAQPHNP